MALEKLSTSPILSDDHISRLRNPDLLTQLTLDVSWYINIENFDSEELGSFELYTREYLHRPWIIKLPGYETAIDLLVIVSQ